MQKTYEIRLTQKAASDLEKIIIYYENQQIGLGTRFASYVYTHMEQLTNFPNAFRAGLKLNTREMVLTKFPFIVVYRIECDVVNILTVYHQIQRIPLEES